MRGVRGAGDYACGVKTFSQLSEIDRDRVVRFASALSRQPGADWYAASMAVLDGPGASIELGDLFWTELFCEVQSMHVMETWQASLRSALYGESTGMVDYESWVEALQQASVIAGVEFKDVLDAYYE